MLIEGKKVWLFVAELNAAGVSTEYIYKKKSESEKFSRPTWKGRKMPGGLVIDYDSLPETTKAKLPSRADLIKQHQADNTENKIDRIQEACETLKTLHEQNSFINDYTFFLKRTSSQHKAEDLKQAAGWLRLLNRYRTPKETRTINFKTKVELRTAVVEQLLADFKERHAHLYGFKITNVAVLQRKELEWASAFGTALESNSNEPKIQAERLANEAALNTLVHANVGNSNRRVLGKLNENESERILLPSGKIDFSEWNARTLVYLFQNPGKANKYDFENIERRYKLECGKCNRQPAVEISAIKEFLTCNEVKQFCVRERHGWAELDKTLPHVYRKRPQFSLSKGGYDGFQVDFTSRIEKKQYMLTVVAVFDYMSEAVTGFDIGDVEDGLMVRNMYRNHLNLMGGRSFIEIESDRGSGNLAAETRAIFEKTCDYVTQPVPNDPQGKAPNPKARFVERLIQELNRLTQNFEGWKGTNITSIDKNRKPNPDYRSGNFVEGLSESVQQIIQLINIYNNDVYNRTQSRIAECMENINPKAPTIPQEVSSMLLNQNTITTVRNSKILIEVNRRPYEYTFPEADKFAHMMLKGYKVKVYYDETDMSTVDVFGVNDQYIGRLGKLHRISGAKAEQTHDDLAGLGEMVSNRKAAIERIEGVSRKMLEVEAAELGIDISNMSIEDAQEMIAGMKHITPQELFAEALATPNAQLTKSYYEDRLLRANGAAVPVSKEDQKGLDDQRREFERERAKRKGHI